MAEQSGYWRERALGMVHVETRGSCVDLGRAWVSSVKGVVIVSFHGIGERRIDDAKIGQLFNVRKRSKLCKKRTLFLEVGPGGLRDED